MPNNPWSHQQHHSRRCRSHAAMSFRRALAPRSIHIRIVPRPANLSESREIYRVLQKFGELDTFKYLRVRHFRPILPAPGTTSCSARKLRLTPLSTNTKTPQTMSLLPSTATKGPLSAPWTPRPSASPWKKSFLPPLPTHHSPLRRKKMKKAVTWPTPQPSKHSTPKASTRSCVPRSSQTAPGNPRPRPSQLLSQLPCHSSHQRPQINKSSSPNGSK